MSKSRLFPPGTFGWMWATGMVGMGTFGVVFVNFRAVPALVAVVVGVLVNYVVGRQLAIGLASR
jgi:hypothetical protein